eukprot:scaffold3068_cov269-Pinguiococcus_pyrenoidosus.AAC.5
MFEGSKLRARQPQVGSKGTLEIHLVKEFLGHGTYTRVGSPAEKWPRIEERQLLIRPRRQHDQLRFGRDAEIRTEDWRQAGPYLENLLRSHGREEAASRINPKVVWRPRSWRRAGRIAYFIKARVDSNSLSEAIQEEHVSILATSSLAQPQQAGKRIIRRDGVRTVHNISNEQRIVHPREGPVADFRPRDSWTVNFDCMLRPGAQHHEDELQATLIPQIHVDTIVETKQDGHVLHIDGPAEELDAVVDTVGHLNVVHAGPSSNACERDAIQFFILPNDRTSVPHADVAESAGVVQRVGSTIAHARQRGAREDDPTPQPTLGQMLVRKHGRERDWPVLRSGGNKPGALLDNESGSDASVGPVVLVAKNRRAVLDCEGRSALHRHLTGQQNRIPGGPQSIRKDAPTSYDSRYVVRHLLVLIQPREAGDPEICSTKCTFVIGRRQERVVHVDVQVVERVTARNRPRVNHRRIDAGIRVDVLRCESRLRAVRRLKLAVGIASGENDVVRGEEEKVPRRDFIVVVQHILDGLRMRLPSAIVLEDPGSNRVRDDHVCEDSAGAFAEPYGGDRVIVAARGTDLIAGVPNEMSVVHDWECSQAIVRRCFFKGVHLGAMVRVSRQHNERELDHAVVSLVNIDAVVATEKHGHVLRIYCPPKELDAVVDIEGHLHEVYDGAPSDSSKRDPVYFVVIADDRAAVPDSHVLKHAGAVLFVDASIHAPCVRDALDDVLPRVGPSGDRSVSQQDEASPKSPRGKIFLGHDRAEGDGVLELATRDEGCPPLNYKSWRGFACLSQS